MVAVSYVVLGGYAAFVVISSLLVGILPPLVNLPDCTEDNAIIIKQPSNINQDLPVKISKPTEKLVQNEKHSKISKRDTSKNVLERTNAFQESHPGYLSKLSNRAYPNLTVCSELVAPVPGVRYPWYESRLPNYIAPINYDVELFVPTWSSPIYDGEIGNLI